MVVRKAEERPVPQLVGGWLGKFLPYPGEEWAPVRMSGGGHTTHTTPARPGFSPLQGLKCGEPPTNTRWRKSGTEKANGDFPSIARSMTGGGRTLAQVQGLKHGRWHGQWVQLANATTAEFLHTSDVIPQVRSPSGRVMKLCHFDAGFTLSKILSHPP